MIIESDFHDVNGKVLGRAKMQFPDDATSEDRIKYFEAMILIEKARATAIPLKFNDLKWFE
jgi:hypothetical protein